MTPDALSTLIHRDFASARSGNTQAYERLVVATQRMVASVALSVTRDVGASEDIAQDTYLRAWQHLGQMRHPDSFLPWLRHVARNRAVDHLRTRRHQTAGPDALDALPDSGAGPEQSLILHQRAEAFAQALDDLPADSREVLLLFYREGQSSQAVAALLGLSDGAVRKRLQRAREGLRADVLQRLGEYASGTAPGVLFTAAVATGLVIGSPPAAAAVTAGALAKGAPKLVLATAGALAATIAVVIGAVAWEIRGYLRRTRDPRTRRTLILNGATYAALMSGYIGALWWTSQQGWSGAQVLGMAVGVSLAVIALGIQRARLTRGLRKPGDGPNAR